MTSYTQKGHIVRALYEAISFRILEILKSLCSDSKIEIKSLKVDGGMTSSNEFLQTQANISQIKVIKSKEQQTTILGAAVVSGLSSEANIWTNINELKKFIHLDSIYNPQWNKDLLEYKLKKWDKAIEKAKNWI